jgi:ATP-binding cassette subfamily F protein uup
MQILAAAGSKNGIQPDQGTIRTAEGIRIVYFTQERHLSRPEATLRQTLSPEGDSIMYRGRPVHVATWAQKFLFRTDQLETPVGNLSGGEKARIHIARLMRQPADILLLDEPTNDLDIPSLQVLEESLLEFSGAVVLATHDRYLLNRVCQQVLGFAGQGKIVAFADFEQWHRYVLDKEKIIAKPAVTSKKKKTGLQEGRLSYLDQREYDRMEETILEAETQEQQVLKIMNDPGNVTNPELLENSWKDLEELRERIQQLYARWDELETKKNRCG